MATVTPNFNWPVPTSTDLVKDGATAIEALGDSIDASLLDLKGGTTGQVLSKTTNTDMDFVWVTTDDANAIQNSIVDAKGDLISATANDTPARLAVGSNGETLVADSSTSTGLRYTAGNPISNPTLNSSFQVWQRGTSISATASNAYTADRWQLGANTAQTCTVSRQATNDTTNLPNIQYCARVQRNSGQTATGAFAIAQSMESVNSIPFAGKTVTLSFYARAGANYSPTSNTLYASIYTGTGTDQNVLTGFTSGTAAVASNLTITTTWVRYSITGTLGATATQLGIYINATPTGTAGTNDYFEITGVQIDIGSVALPFRTYAGTIQGELAACQRYYQALSAFGCAGYASGSGASIMNTLPFVTAMRAAPTVTITSNGTTALLTSALIQNTSATSAIIQIVASGAGFSGIYGATTATASIEL
jgi:hypothetical protein